MKKKANQAPAEIPGVRFLIDACRCTECGRIVIAKESVDRGCGPSCWEKAQGQAAYQRLEALGQMRMFSEEVRG